MGEAAEYELAEAWEHKTPGPWRTGIWQAHEYVCAAGGETVRATKRGVLAPAMADARFIALCGTHVGTLLERLRAAEAEVERLREVLGAVGVYLSTVRDDEHADPYEQDNAGRLCLLIAAALHPEEHCGG